MNITIASPIEAIQELITIRDMLRWATSCFNAAELYYGHGTDNAWDDALQLVFHTLHLPINMPSSIQNARLTSSERKTIADLINRRVTEKIPVPYLTKEAWFAGLNFYVDQRVLVPRSPIAELIENHFSPWINIQPQHILDLCTGSGCIAIACAHYFPETHIVATDISADALAVAKINAENHGVDNRVQLIQSDLFKALPKQKFDLIVSNPPYVDEHDMTYLPDEFKHEPQLGLAAGREGLDFAIQILKSSAQYLTTDGLLILEVGNSEKALVKRFPNVPFLWLEFERGGEGVLLLTAEQLHRHEKEFR